MAILSGGLINALAFRFVFDDAADRAAATGFGDGDVATLALQLDDQSAWLLAAVAPVAWVQLGGTGASDAVDVTYDPAASGLSSTNAQDAIDEIAALGGGGGAYPTRATMWHDEAAIVSGGPVSADQGPGGTLFAMAGHQDSGVSPFAQSGDAFEQDFTLAAGSYTLHILGSKGTNRGKLDWTIDGSPVATGQDWYNGSQTANDAFAVAITVATDGLHTLRGTVNGKNGSSGGYFIVLTKYWIGPS